MLFNSYSFLFGFLPVFAAIYFGIVTLAPLGVKQPAALLWIVVASLLFYAIPSVAFLWLLLLSIVVNYGVSILLQRLKGQGAAKTILVAAIVFNLGLLGYYKYAGFFSANLNALFGTSFAFGSAVLPLAISFFTFQKIHYLIDVYRGGIRNINVAHYAAFVTFFPQLISGPIVKYQETVPQFADPDHFRFDPANISIGSTIFFIGLFKKVVLADSMAPFADQVFGSAAAGASLSTRDAWVGVLGYTLQIYFDFSGYSDMAIGLARIFNITFPANFDSPYQATNIAEFWRRWHITLYRFLRDYVYVPLGGNRRGPTRGALNVLITMGLSGLWHGAGWTFIIWGLLHGFYLVIFRVWSAVKPNFAGVDSPLLRTVAPLAGWLPTMAVVVFAWVFFRADSLSSALGILHSMIGGVSSANTIRGGRYLTEIAIVAAIALFLPNTQQWMGRFEPVLGKIRPLSWPAFEKLRWSPSPYWLTALIVTATIAITWVGDAREHIYYRF